MVSIEDIEQAIKERRTVIFSSRCTIQYEGRAKTHLEEGDRIFIIKPDSTLLVHQVTGSSPVNYMKPTTVHKIVKDGEVAYLKSENIRQKEHLRAELRQIHFLETPMLKDEAKIQLAGNEKDMSDFLYANPEMVEPGFTPLSREEHTKYGFIDVFGYDTNGVLTIIECKRYNADFSAVDQLRRYVEKIKSSKGIDQVRGIMASPAITSNAKTMLENWGFTWKKIEPPKKLTKSKNQKGLGDF
ncbi:endonuclease NucS [Candidatus Woesearchaeota archaeon]|nr:endonuclease NucS [Candidatus Woesearchaeota archaeon]